jgi:hypothetical protein
LPKRSIQEMTDQYLAAKIPEASDAGKRAAEIINGYIIFMGIDEQMSSKCVAIRLSDGGYDGNVYDNKQAAVAHQLHEYQCMYIFFRNLGFSLAKPREMDVLLGLHRDAYKRGLRLADPAEVNGGPDVIMTTPEYDSRRRIIR